MLWADAIPNLLIGLREGLEAGLIVTILLAATSHTRVRRARAAVWIGVACAVELSLCFGAVLTFYSSVLSSRAQQAFGGFLSVLAVALITFMVFWMRRTARSLPGTLGEKVETALEIGVGALALTAFLVVGREGLETALFIWAAGQAAPQSLGPIVGALLGICVAVTLCTLLYRHATSINLSAFFSRTGVLLIVVAAGVLSYGLGELQEARLLPGHALTAFDLSRTVTTDSWWGSILTGVTNLSPRLTGLQVTAYLGFLGSVLWLFLLTNRGAPVPKRRPSLPRRGRPYPSRRVAWVGIGAVILFPIVVTSGLVAARPASVPSARISVTAAACARGWSSARTGVQTFTVANDSGYPGEINLVRATSGAVVAEIETLGPGTDSTLSATLTAVGYRWRCLLAGLPVHVSATVQPSGPPASGSSRPVTLGVIPVTVGDLQGPAAQYRSYVEGKLVVLTGQVERLQGDLARGNLAAARRDWLPAQMTWDEVGAAYDSFGALGDAIDGLPFGLRHTVANRHFTGLHRLEFGLWHDQSSATLQPLAIRLISDLAMLRSRLPAITVDPTDLPLRAHEILEDAARDHLSGIDDLGAGAAMPETYADARGTQIVLSAIAPLLASRRPELVSIADRQLRDLRRALVATRRAGRWRRLAEISLAQRQAVDAATGAVLETLADVPDLLEVPPSH